MSRPPLPASRTSSSNWEDEFKKVKYQGQGEEPLADQAVGLLKALLLPLLPLASFLARPLAACLARRPPVSGVMNARSGPGGGGGGPQSFITASTAHLSASRSEARAA
jgi:hypothetical protein